MTDSSYGIPAGPTRRLYQCGDGRFITLAAPEPKTWTALCQGLGLPELAEGGRMAWDKADEVSAQLEAIFASRPASEWVELLGPLGGRAVNRAPTSSTTRKYRARKRGRGRRRLGAGQSDPDDGGDGPRTSTNASPPAIGADTDAILAAAAGAESRRAPQLGRRRRLKATRAGARATGRAIPPTRRGDEVPFTIDLEGHRASSPAGRASGAAAPTFASAADATVVGSCQRRKPPMKALALSPWRQRGGSAVRRE
jgi:hypothetical protein